MRTTLDIAEDVLQTAKGLARPKGNTAGQVISELAALMLLLAGCATNQLYEGQARPKSEVVRLQLPRNMSGQIRIGGQWVKLQRRSTLLPGTYQLSILCAGTITGSAGARGILEASGFMHRGLANVPDEFTARGGDTVTYSWGGPERIVVGKSREVWHCTGFRYTLHDPRNNAVH